MDTLTIRRATAADATALRRLAALDSAELPAGPHLVAESGNHLIAAASTHDGTAVADPFARSADAVALLRRRIQQLRGADAPRRFRRAAGVRALRLHG